ncbi:hypothetical protein [Verrucomicrobium sp. BvORR106]|uniref:hypothetical protein n=1 Tax=Verrucomicrobium sp. BvORR106 TaxID=1403819 RepID=UPI0005716BC0|nr:hypothetical protein [Verrucomicrobium sp. BvORR106]
MWEDGVVMHARKSPTPSDTDSASPALHPGAGRRVARGAVLTALVIAGGLSLLAVTWCTAHRDRLSATADAPLPVPVNSGTSRIQPGDALHPAAYAPLPLTPTQNP